MELVINSSINDQVVDNSQVINNTSGFIEANTQKVTLEHLKNDCIIPVFSKDNETTISHYQFINKAYEVVSEMFPDFTPKDPDIRVSHIIKGRIPSAIGKPAKDLLESEKTLYYERCAFLIELHQAKEVINGNALTLSVGGGANNRKPSQKCEGFFCLLGVLIRCTLIFHLSFSIYLFEPV